MADIDLGSICDCCSSSSSSVEVVCRNDLTTLYATYSCSPDCECRDGDTAEFVGGEGSWIGPDNPCNCDANDTISCIDGTWFFTSCQGSGYPNPPGIPVNVVSTYPLYIVFGPWTHQSVNLCAYPGEATCTVIVTE